MNPRLGTHLRANVFVERVRVDNDDNTGVTSFKEKISERCGYRGEFIHFQGRTIA